MSLVEYICSSDIEDKNTIVQISDLLVKSDKFIYLTATQSLKNIRFSNDILSEKLYSYKTNLDNANLFSSNEFFQHIRQEVIKKSNFLSVADSRYILSQVIDFNFNKNHDKYNTFYKMRYDLFELFRLLMFNDINITSEQMAQISHNFSFVEEDIFNLYKIYRHTTKEVINTIKTGKKNVNIEHILGENFLKNVKIKDMDTFINKQKEQITLQIKQINIIVMDGFLFFDDMQKYLIKVALENQKKIVFIYKTFNNEVSNFIFEQLANELNTEYIKPSITDNKTNFDTALSYCKCVFPDLTKNKAINKELLNDGSIRIFEPFVNRDEELRFIVKDISNRLKNYYMGDTEEIKSIVNNDFAIVTGIEKEKYQERISNLFREVGLFIYKGKKSMIDAGLGNIDDSVFEKVYFNRDDFLNTNISGIDYNIKYFIFEKCFSRIKINKTQRPIATYPIGQFILELYSIINNGMTVDGFKTILYSNWRYTVDKASLVWSEYISDFKYIEMFFEGCTNINEWITEIENIKTIKSDISDNDLYKYHPVFLISNESIEFYANILYDLKEMTESINCVNGSIDTHLEVLKKTVMKADELLGFENDDLEFEQIIIKKLVNAISDIGSKSIMNSLSAKYFAENIKLMLTDWENQNENEDNDGLLLNIVNLENMKNYRHTYFIMAEADKYPRQYHETFPFTKDIQSILSDKKYGINIRSGEVLGLDYHLKLEKYLFKNVLDFSKDTITITSSEKEYNKHTKPCIFVYDIFRILGITAKYLKPYSNAYNHKSKFTNPVPSLGIDKKQRYTLTELAIFKLCPKMYYHFENDNNKGAYLSKLQMKFYAEAIIYCDLFRIFMEYNLANKKVYRKDENEYKLVIKNLFECCFNENIRNFPFLCKYESMDIHRNVANKMIGFIENGMKYVKSNQYTVITLKNKVYKGSDYELVIEHDNRYVDYINRTYRMSQNSTYLEFLVLKTSDGQSMLKHYDEMIEALDKNVADEDRINLVSRIIAKINMQFNSGRFVDDGIERTDKLVNDICKYEFSNAESMKSDYCNYCRLRDICMGV